MKMANSKRLLKIPWMILYFDMNFNFLSTLNYTITADLLFLNRPPSGFFSWRPGFDV